MGTNERRYPKKKKKKKKKVNDNERSIDHLFDHKRLFRFTLRRG